MILTPPGIISVWKFETNHNYLSDAERAYRIYDLMLNGDGKSSLKAIVAQCLASALRWRTSKI
ncbi:MAG: hypothetical protein IKS46_04085, partial [Clostridia bacterium]|nr:hypothetical protein [Clostridia bacterium]